MLIKKTKEFTQWLDKLEWIAQAQILDRLNRIEELGHFGDVKHLGKGLCELRWANGLRVYFIRYVADQILLLKGGHKNDQKKDIERAKILYKRYSNS